ncbi:AAA family ATPase [Candidatus Poribacteria bacterium]|nr:AAA family ATPase [Candidatus Poribacteria bacterium]
MNLLVGANGAGKSNFVAVFSMLSEMMAGRLQEFLAKTGRASSNLYLGPKATPALELQMDFSLADRIVGYAVRLMCISEGTLSFIEESFSERIEGESVRRRRSHCLSDSRKANGAGYLESVLNDVVAVGEAAIRILAVHFEHCRPHHFHDTSATSPLRQHCYIGDSQRLRSDAGNLAAMLYAYRQSDPGAYARILSTVRQVIPDFDSFELEPDRVNPREIILNWRRRGSDYLLGPHQLSDGSLRAMAILTLFLQPEADLPKVIVLDEPELGLHPHALEIVAGLMRAASLRTQVIVATQSPTLVDHFRPEEVIVAESGENGSQFRRLSTEDLNDWLEDYSLGELWRRNVLGGGPLP